MSIPIRVLIIEDSEDDLLLVLREFKRGGYEPIYTRVETRETLEEALKSQPWDIIISDYTMPRMTGLMALDIVQNSLLDIPFIIVSGNVGEDIAVAAMKAGAHDYLMKDNLTRLIPAIERELRESEVRWARKRAEMTVHHLTYHDALTGLLNRREFERRVASAIESARSQHKQHGLCIFDLDQFKIINDTCGHLAGDELLKQLALTIQQKITESESIARLGGDEFGLLVENSDIDNAYKIADELRDIISSYRFNWRGETYSLSASIGLMMIDKDISSLAKTLSSADIACFAAKDQGGNRIYIFDEEDTALNKHYSEMQMVSKITKALKEDRFALYCQTIYPIENNSHNDIAHGEILLRMIDEEGVVVSPNDFMPSAERYNLMPTIDRWVIDQAFQYKRQQQQNAAQQNTTENYFSINISGASINDDTFMEFIHRKTKEHHINPKFICFEITETTAIKNLTKANQFISELRSSGFSFALDDFGSGLSSFSYLKNLRVDFLKIDGSLVREIHNNLIDYTMVESIHRIGQVIGIKTIAEFVENRAILEKLSEIGVDFAQGYGIDKPVEIDKWIPGTSVS